MRSGGHGISGRSTNDGGIVIDVSALDAIEVLDEERRLVRVGPGARWEDVAAALAPYGWALTSGDYGGVGVGGLATAGGIGWLAREHGLTIDHLRAAEVVLADGSVVRADATEIPELFWACAAPARTSAIVTSFEFEAGEVGDVGWAQLAFDASDTADFLERWGATMEAAPATSRASHPRRAARGSDVRAGDADGGLDDPDTILERLQPFAEIAPLVTAVGAARAVRRRDGQRAGRSTQRQGEPGRALGLIDHFTPEVAAELARMLESGACDFFQVRSVGGAVADVPEDATAYAHRSANFSVARSAPTPPALDAQWDTLEPPRDRALPELRDRPARPERSSARSRRRPSRASGRSRRASTPTDLFRDNFALAPGPRPVRSPAPSTRPNR